MKKSICALLFCLLLFTTGIAASAEGLTQYEIGDIGLSLAIPDSFYVWTRDTQADDPVFDQIGYGYSDLMSILYNNNAYFEAISQDFYTEIIISAAESPTISDLGLLQPDMKELRLSNRAEQLEQLGVEISDYEFFAHPQAEFYKYYYEQPIGEGTVYYGIKYYTIINNYEYDVQITSYSGEITESLECQMDAFVSSFTFDRKDQVMLGEGTRYTDPETGLTFVVPSGFTEMELTEEQKASIAKGYSSSEGELIMYSKADVWNELSAAEKLLHKRSSMDIDYFSRNGLKEFLEGIGSTKEEVSLVKKGNMEFYETSVEKSDSGITTQLRVDSTMIDGYLYIFMDMALQNSDYSAMDELLASVGF